jgi:demethylmenaquinone methyltransferase/2-methoxy-6-polyprenyl-1,4-benzoquinol methylase
MGNSFYDAGGQRAAKVSDLFSRIARRYDLINDLQSLGLHRRWKRAAVDLARIQPGATALDICCGTGDIAFALAARGAQVWALDFNAQMLDVAMARQPAQRGPTTAPPITFIRGDAQKLPFADGIFQAVTMGYGLRNLTSWETGLAELIRVTKPGGKIAILEFGKPDNVLWRNLYFLYLRLFVPLLGLVFCGNAAAYAYILESLNHYPAQHGVARKMSDLNLAGVRVVSILGGVMSINYGEKPTPR